MTTLADNEGLAIVPNRAGQKSLNADELAQQVVTTNNIASMVYSGAEAGSIQLFDDTGYTKIQQFDNTTIQQGAVSTDPANDQMTVSTSGTYQLEAGFSLGFPGGTTRALAILPYVDNIAINQNRVNIKSTSAGPPVPAIIFKWQWHIDLKSGNIIDLRALQYVSPGTATVTFYQAFFTLTQVA